MIFDWILATGLGAALFGKTISEQTNKELIRQPRIDAEKKIADAKARLKDEYIKMYNHFHIMHQSGPIYYLSTPQKAGTSKAFYVDCASKQEVLSKMKNRAETQLYKLAIAGYDEDSQDIFPFSINGTYILETMSLIMSDEEKEKILKKTKYNPPSFTERDFLTFGDPNKTINITEIIPESMGYGLSRWEERPLVIGSPYAMYHQHHCIKSSFYLEHEDDPQYQDQIKSIRMWNVKYYDIQYIRQNFPPPNREDEISKLHAVAATYEYFRLRNEKMSRKDLMTLLQYAGISERIQSTHIVW